MLPSLLARTLAQAFVDEMVDIRAIGRDLDPVDFLPLPQNPGFVA